MNPCRCGWQGEPVVPRSGAFGLLGALLAGPTLIVLATAIAGWAGADAETTGAIASVAGGPGSVFGFIWGYCIARTGRLSPNRGPVCIGGKVMGTKRMSRTPVLAGFTWDPDWTFDVLPRGTSLEDPGDLICEDAELVRCQVPDPLIQEPDPSNPIVSVPTIHCEIPSAIGRAGCIGGMIGSAIALPIGRWSRRNPQTYNSTPARGKLPAGRRHSRRGRQRAPRLRRLPQGPLAPDLVRQRPRCHRL